LIDHYIQEGLGITRKLGLGEYWDEMPESNFEVDLKKKTHLFSIDSDLAVRLTEIAKSRHVASQVLVNNWLKEKIMQQV